MNDFKPFGALVRQNLDAMTGEVYHVDCDVNKMWEFYLVSFPEGTNPVFRERTEHDCSCCKNFIRNVGHTITITGGKIATIWDELSSLTELYPYNVVASKMEEYIRGFAIKNLYRSHQSKHGAMETIESAELRWNHFHAELPRNLVDKDAGPLLSRMESSHQVFNRGLKEITPESLVDILDLIYAKSLYRGEEHMGAVQAFQNLQQAYNKLNSDEAREIYVWEHVRKTGSGFRNTVIGTLAVDLSGGITLEDAVGKFEAKVAPENYKRPTALITPRMIETAVATLSEFGLSDAVHRRFARLSDVSVNNVLFVDNDVQGEMKDGLTELLMEEAVATSREVRNPTPISIDKFMSIVLPDTTTLELLLSNDHLSNFVSLTAPQKTDTGQLFKWDNDFAWSYDGEVTDSIGAKVEKAGGRVAGAKMRFSLSWFNFDDLDIHVRLPTGATVYYSNRMGLLDVDMNVSPTTRDAVENVSWMSRPQDGKYIVKVHQFQKRETIDTGFILEIESAGKIRQYRYENVVTGMLPTLEILVKDGVITKVAEMTTLTSKDTPKEKWGLKTLELVRVNTLMFSPNHWDNQAIGNKHWFFMVDKCVNPSTTRGFYNEFLTPSLEKHRKVFEILGQKTKCPSTSDQLSGLGFSSTRKDKVIILANSKPYEITF